MNSSTKTRARRLVAISIALIALLLPGRLLRADSGIPIPDGTWTFVLTHGLPAEANGWEQLVYVPPLKQSVMLGQYHQNNSEPNESLVGYNFVTNSWNVIDMGGDFHTEAIPEGGESQGFFNFNPNNNTIAYHCCTSGSNQPEDINHDWWYDVLGQSGRDKQTSPKPPADVLLPGGTFDVAHNVLIFEGGASFTGTWAYDPVGNSWKQMFPTGTLPDPSLALPGLAYSTATQQIYLFGGHSENFDTDPNDLYVYNYPTNTWTLINPVDGVKPPGRTGHAFAYDSTNNIFLLFGGEVVNSVTNAGLNTILNDTWVYDPVANKWTQVNTPGPPVSNAPIFAKMSYDSDHNVFVIAQVEAGGGYYGGIWVTYPVQTWLFRYAGGGPNAGAQLPTAAPAAGGLNRYSSGWAKDPVLASSGNSLYVAWSELGSPFTTTNSAWPHMYVSQYSGGSWAPLGTSFNSVSTDIFEAHAPSMAIVNGVPWISYYQQASNGQTAQVYSSSWSGASTWNGGAVGFDGGGSPLYQGQSQITAVGAVPNVALLEVDKSVFPQRTLAYVRAWNGSVWSLMGTALNQNTSAGDTALSVSIASNGANPVVAWSEYVHTANQGDGYDYDSNPQIYVSQWNGSQWAALGTSLNVSTANWAYDPSVAYLGGTVYVAWVERTQTGNNQLYVKAWNGSSWVQVGSGALNQAPGAGWAYHPSLLADPANNSLYLGWVEQVALGQKAHVFVSQYASGSWTSLGGALNVDPVNGSAQRVSIGIFNGQPVAAWGEINMGATRQVFVKQWNGSSWNQLPGPPVPDTTAPTIPGGLTATVVSPTQINLAWTLATDLVGTTGYYVSRNGAQVATVTSTLTYHDTGLAPNTAYCYTVAAFDAAGNVSSPSAAACTGLDVSSVNLASASVIGGTSTTSNSVSLNGPAPNGAVVTLSSNNSAATVPASVTVAAGAVTSSSFTITTSAVATSTPVTISASYNGFTATNTLTVRPPSPTLVTLSPASVVGGTSSTLNSVTLNGPAPAGGAVVTLMSNNAAAAVPASVTVAAGASVSPTFTIGTSPVGSSTPVTISASFNGVTVPATLTVGPLTVVTVAPASPSVVGGVPTSGTVSLNGPASSPGAIVTLSSNNPAVSVPASVTVSAGATASPTFTITTSTVSTTTPVTISATYNGVTVSTTLSVSPVGGPTLLLHLNASEVTGTQNGSTVTPSVGPGGFTGTVVVNSGGSVNFAPAEHGDGVYFLNCCGNTDNAYYGFTSAAVGNVFNVNQGQISFFLQSRYTFAQRVASASGQRYAFDVRDGNGNHLFNFLTQITSGSLLFTYSAAGAGTYYFVPAGTEDALFGNGVLLQVTMTWGSGTSNLYLNGQLVKSVSLVPPTPNWSAASTFYLGAYNFQTFGGYSSSDDAIADFAATDSPLSVSVVTLSPLSIAGGTSTTLNTVSLTGPAPAGGAFVTLSSNNPAAVVPASVTVAVGSTTSPSFTITTSAVATNTPVTISATYGGVTATGTLTIQPSASAVTVTAVTLSPASVPGGTSSTSNTVSLTGSAPAGGAVVTLSSNNPAAVVPASVTVAAGSITSPSFTITTSAVSTSTPVTISAKYGGVTATGTLTVQPPTPSAVTLSPASVLGGTSTTSNTVSLTGSAPASGAVVTLSSNNPAAVVPASVTVAAGSTISPSFTITTSAVTVNTPVTISATYNSVTVTATLSLTAPVSAGGPALLLHLNASEVNGTQNGSTVTPSIGPAGFTGTAVVNSGGSVNFAPAENGDGVYFLNCCGNTDNAYYEFSGTSVGSVFNVSQGQISFYLQSRYTFAQRAAMPSSQQRYAFDVRDGNGSHLFDFFTEISQGSLLFTYSAAGAGTYYFVPSGTENTLFGSGVVLRVTMTWGSGTSNLFLNGQLVKSVSLAPPTPNWSAASNFDLGAYQYLNFGGYSSSDDTIADFTVANSPSTTSIMTSPEGLLVSVDGGTAQVAPFAVNLTPGSHTLAVAMTQAGGTGTQYVFTGWSDSGAASHSITVGTTPVTYTATFQTQYRLTTAASPSAGGTMTPPSGAFYNAASVVSVQAAANSGYQFANFSSGVTGSGNPQSITMNGPGNVVANFTPVKPSLAATVGARTVAGSTVLVNLTLTNTGLGAATDATITGITAFTDVAGSGTVTVASGTPANLGTIIPGSSATATITLNWPSSATRVSFTVKFTADGGYTGSSTVTALY